MKNSIVGMLFTCLLECKKNFASSLRCEPASIQMVCVSHSLREHGYSRCVCFIQNERETITLDSDEDNTTVVESTTQRRDQNTESDESDISDDSDIEEEGG